MVIDAQNEFCAGGRRAVPNHSTALAAIHHQVDRARQERRPIAWVRHRNKPNEASAFIPGTWGAELSPGLGPKTGFGHEFDTFRHWNQAPLEHKGFHGFRPFLLSLMMGLGWKKKQTGVLGNIAADLAASEQK